MRIGALGQQDTRRDNDYQIARLDEANEDDRSTLLRFSLTTVLAYLLISLQ